MAWRTLFKKELFLGAGTLGTGKASLLMLLGVIGISVYLSYQFESGIVTQIWLVIINAQIIAPMLYMLGSLRKEQQLSPLWMQMPLSGWKLLGAKYAAAFVEMAIGLVVSIGVFFWVYEAELGGTESADGVAMDMDVAAYRDFFLGLFRLEGIQEVLSFLIIAFALSALAVLIYVVAISLKHRLGGVRWLLSVVAVASAFGLMILFEMTPVYSFLFEWVQISEDESLYAGELIWLLLSFTLLLYVPARLLDRQVEV